MRALKRGMSGDDVRLLQEALLKAGFNPGDIDGRFGGGTEAALLAYQASERLLADGIAGPRTLSSLGLEEKGDLPQAASAISAEMVSVMFPATPIGHIRQNLPAVLGALQSRRLGDKPMVLMALATIRAETASFLPESEGLSRFNTSPGGHRFDLYDNRHDLGNQGPPDGERYRGRGFVQLTGRDNYRTYGPKLTPPVDLEANPDLACNADVAADLLALFLGDREREIKEALLQGNMARARRLVNGGSHGLAAFTDAYEKGNALPLASL